MPIVSTVQQSAYVIHLQVTPTQTGGGGSIVVVCPIDDSVDDINAVKDVVETTTRIQETVVQVIVVSDTVECVY